MFCLPPPGIRAFNALIVSELYKHLIVKQRVISDFFLLENLFMARLEVHVLSIAHNKKLRN